MSATDVEPATAITRMPALDGLRGIAILLVVCHHYGVPAGFPGPGHGAVGRVLERFFYVGWAGVDLFFVLSGFLISSILLATRHSLGYFQNFYARRALRIFPLYFGALLLGLALLPAVWPLPARFIGQTHGHTVWLWTYTSNIALGIGVVTTFGVYDLFWSLAIEEQFYAAWPLLVRLTRPRYLAAICGAVVAGALIWRAAWLAQGGAWWKVYRFTPTRLDDLAIGALVALAVREPAVRMHTARVLPWILAVACGAFALMFASNNPFYPSDPAVLVYGPTVLGVLFGGVVFLAATSPAGRLASTLGVPWLRGWGRISYGIYVWHWPLRMALEKPYSQIVATSRITHYVPATGLLVIGLLGSYGIAWVSYHAYEQHFLRLKRRVAYAAVTTGSADRMPLDRGHVAR